MDGIHGACAPRDSDHRTVNTYVRNFLGLYNTVTIPGENPHSDDLINDINTIGWTITKRLDNNGIIRSLLFLVLFVCGLGYFISLTLVLHQPIDKSESVPRTKLPPRASFYAYQFFLLYGLIVLPSAYLGIVLAHRYDKRSHTPSATTGPASDTGNRSHNNNNAILMTVVGCLLGISAIAYLLTRPSTTEPSSRFSHYLVHGSQLFVSLALILPVVVSTLSRMLISRFLNTPLSPDTLPKRYSFKGTDDQPVSFVDNDFETFGRGVIDNSADKKMYNQLLGYQCWGGLFTYPVNPTVPQSGWDTLVLQSVLELFFVILPLVIGSALLNYLETHIVGIIPPRQRRASTAVRALGLFKILTLLCITLILLVWTRQVSIILSSPH